MQAQISTADYNGPSRRESESPGCAGNCPPLDAVHARLDAGDARMTSIETKLDANCTDTSEVLDILRLGKSFFRVVGYFGAFAKWSTAIAAPVLVFWYTLKGGGK